MKSSILMYLDRGDTVHVLDSSSLPHTNEISPLMLIVAEIIIAGFKGVMVDEYRLANGRYFQALNVDKKTPEGQIISRLRGLDQTTLPTPRDVLNEIRQAYLSKTGAA